MTIINMKIKLLFAILISSLLGCSTLNTVLKEKEKGNGKRVVYNIQFEDAWLISKSSFRWAGCDAIEEHKSDGYMLTSKGKDIEDCFDWFLYFWAMFD